MEKFDLERALNGEPVMCRDGTPVVTLAHFPSLPPFRQVIVAAEGSKFTREHLPNGRYFPEAGRDSGFDLFMKTGRTKKSNVCKGLQQLEVEGEEV